MWFATKIYCIIVSQNQIRYRPQSSNGYYLVTHYRRSCTFKISYDYHTMQHSGLILRDKHVSF